MVGAAGLVCVSTATGRDSSSSAPQTAGTAVGGSRLASYTSCADMLAGLRQHAARNVGIWGTTPPGLAPAAAGNAGGIERAAAAPVAAPPHSATNDCLAGADEPDLVKTDGNRVITVEHGVLRIVNTATSTVTARLKLAARSGHEVRRICSSRATARW